MRYGQFKTAFDRAWASNGPWFPSDDLDLICQDIAMFCQEDWEDMMDATSDQKELREEISEQIRRRAAKDTH